MKYNLVLLIFTFSFNFYLNAQSKNLTFSEIKYNVDSISKLLDKQDGTSGYDYYQISIDNNGNRWFCLSWTNLDGLYVTEQKYSQEIAVKFFNMAYNNYNYSQDYPMNKIDFINALIAIKITGLKTITKKNVFYFKWQELVDKGYF